jgi:hypothetical protein
MILDQREEKQELVEYVEQEKSIQEQRLERMNASAIQRFRWWLSGKD